MKDSKLNWSTHATESLSGGIAMGALLLFFKQPIILVVVISAMFALILLIMHMMHEFMSMSIEVDRQLEKVGRQRYFNILNHIKSAEDVLTRHLIRHKNPDYGKVDSKKLQDAIDKAKTQ